MPTRIRPPPTPHHEEILQDLVLQPLLLGRRLQEPDRPLDPLRVQLSALLAKGRPQLIACDEAVGSGELHGVEETPVEVPVGVYRFLVGSHDGRGAMALAKSSW